MPRFDRFTAGRGALLFFAVGQPVTIAISTLVGSDFSRDDPTGPLLVPWGPAFAIWGLIVTLTGVYAVWQAVATVDPRGRGAVAGPLAVTAAGFCAWIASASVPALTVLTLPIFVLMGAGLLLAVRATRRASRATWPRWVRGVLWTALGTHLGWTAIAVWLNASTVLVDAGAPVRGAWGFTWQLSLAAAAAGAAALVLFSVSRTSTPLTLIFGATTVYALVFAAVGALTRNAPLPSLVAAALAVVLAASTALIAAARRGQTASRFARR
ncbi:hypothetical protein [Microbacterium sp. 10M-3C3]|jgi:hypothetical protein|uniref:hypothetical protein n=1 Tax=Microbacterium sp. 10M-3C3 TaxID=2483401 RepID=UPI000F638561|nr:hypothetical protein [Microbacterium sp. 10M-3C3]